MSTACVVVACRLRDALRLGDRPQVVLGWIDELAERAFSLGGTLVASSFDTLVFTWDDAAIQEAVSLALSAVERLREDGREDVSPWTCGIAAGEIHNGKMESPPVLWGKPMAVASALAQVAKPGEVLVDGRVPAVATHELLTNRARVGRVAGKRLRGYRVDMRQPWRALAAAEVARMVDGPLVGRSDELARLLAASKVIILRADSGFGGSRMLAEVAAGTRPARSITLTPFAIVHEPLGALRRAMAFVAATERITLPPNLHPALDQLLGAQGVTVERAALLIAHQIQRRGDEPLPSLLLDDVADLDEPSVDACARAIELLRGEVRVVARIDSMSQLPRSLARFCESQEVDLARFDGELSAAVAGACTGGALEEPARVQWGRRGGGTPLAVVEAVAAGIAKGELLWDDGTFVRRKRTAGSDIARPVGYWIARYAEGLRESSRDVLIALAHMGGEASLAELFDVIGTVAPEIDLQIELTSLARGRWVRESRPGMIVLATRAQREAILEFSRNAHARDWRVAIAKTLENSPGTLRRAEASQHAARAGMSEWAAQLAMAAARTASQAGLEESASTLAAFAGVQNPGGAELDLGELEIDEDVAVAAAAALILGDPATVAAPPAPEAAALLELDIEEIVPDELDIEPEPERAAPRIPPRMSRDTIVELVDQAPAPAAPPASYGRLLAAAQDLRETQWAEVARRSLVRGSSPDAQRRGLLALARAYASEGRSAEALIQALDALARMREATDREGTKTCLLFLARLYEQTERRPEAATLKHAAEASL